MTARLLLAFVWLCAGALATPVVAQTTAPGKESQPRGFARLSGRVVADDNGAPVRRALVRVVRYLQPPGGWMFHPPNVFDSEQQTDENGRFDFQGLAVGAYEVTVPEVDGFVPLHTARAETVLPDGGAVKLTIRLPPAGAIVGRVDDERGEPVAGAEVQALRKEAEGQRPATAVARAVTDDRGQFHLFNLPAREYYVIATPKRPQRAFEQVRGGTDAPQSGYAWTYHPHALALDDARAVLVRKRRTAPDINVSLRPCRLANVQVTAVASSGVPLRPGAYASLNALRDVYLWEDMRHQTLQDEGGFVFTGVAPGDYSLIVSSSLKQEEQAYVRVRVDGTDVAVNIQTNTGARVSGRVIVEGQSSASGRNAWVSAFPPPATFGPSYATGSVAHVVDGKFELKGLRGPMVLSADVASGALVSLRRGGEEITGKTIEFIGTEVIDDVIAVVTTDVASLNVTVTGGRARRTPESALVVLFPDDPEKWRRAYVRTGNTAVTRQTTKQTVSPLQLIRLVPGRYLIAAVPDPAVNYLNYERLVEKVRPFAVPITLTAGETADVTIRLAPLER